jgi:hypothetical protein
VITIVQFHLFNSNLFLLSLFMYSVCHISAAVCCSSLFVCCLHGAVSVQVCPMVKITNVTARGWRWTWKTRRAILGKSVRLKTAQASSLMHDFLLCYIDNCWLNGTWLNTSVTDGGPRHCFTINYLSGGAVLVLRWVFIRFRTCGSFLHSLYHIPTSMDIAGYL